MFGKPLCQPFHKWVALKWKIFIYLYIMLQKPNHYVQFDTRFNDQIIWFISNHCSSIILIHGSPERPKSGSHFEYSHSIFQANRTRLPIRSINIPTVLQNANIMRKSQFKCKYIPSISATITSLLPRKRLWPSMRVRVRCAKAPRQNVNSRRHFANLFFRAPLNINSNAISCVCSCVQRKRDA